MTPPIEEGCVQDRVGPYMDAWRASWHTGWRGWLLRLVTVSAWPPVRCLRDGVGSWMAARWPCRHTGWRWWVWRLVAPGLLRRLSAWPPIVRLEAGLRELVAMPNLLEEDPLHEITLYVDRHNKIHVHHPSAQSQEALILVANVLLRASQVVAAQAGAQVVSQPQAKAG